MTDIAHPGFADPVAGSQACFRAVLDAMARPGAVRAAGQGLTPPAPLDPATAAVLLTLVDAETPLLIGDGFAPVRDWVAFHCGAGFAEASGCAFALCGALPDFDSVSTGSHLAPEESATVILQVAALGRGAPYRLSGPGLREPVVLEVDGLPGDFVARWAANHALFPRGVDVILCAGTSVAALPRSVTVEAV